jgi:HK97 family phage major capsid protein
MDIKEMTIEALEERKAAIAVEVEADGADLDALEAEARSIKEEIERRKNEETQRNEIRKAVANGAGAVEKTFEKEERKTMTLEELRSLPAYVEAYANYIKTGDAKEARALITENAPDTVTGSGPLPVPTIIESGVKTAWENDAIMSRVRRTFVRGNLKVAFELSATAAAVHQEGTNQPTEETLTLGVVELIPSNIKKWITITDEAMDMGGEEFLRYIYDEITYQIVKKAAADGIADIISAPAASNASAVGVPTVTTAPSVTAIPTAAANLSDQATNVVVIMNRLTEVEFINAYAAGNFAVDPFAGLPRVYTSAIPAYSAVTAGNPYAIVGDLNGLQYNFPNGDGVVLKFDDLSLAEKDLVKIVGRQYSAHGVTAPGRFVKLLKPTT